MSQETKRPCRCPQCGRRYRRTYREERDGFGVCLVDRTPVVLDCLSLYTHRKLALARLQLQAGR